MAVLWLLFLPIVAISAQTPSLFDYVCPSPNQDDSAVLMYTEQLVDNAYQLTSLYIHVGDCIEMETTSATMSCTANQITVQRYSGAGCVAANKVGTSTVINVEVPARVSGLLSPNTNVPPIYATCTLAYFTSGLKGVGLLTDGYDMYSTSCSPYTPHDYPVGILYVAPGYDVYLPSGDVFNSVNSTTCKKSDDYMVVTTPFSCNDTCFDITDSHVAIRQQTSLPNLLTTLNHKSSVVPNRVGRELHQDNTYAISMISVYSASIFTVIVLTVMINWNKSNMLSSNA